MLFRTKPMSWFYIEFCLKHDSYTLADGAEIHSLRLDTVALQHKPHRKQDTNRNAGHCSNTVPNVKRGLLSFCYTRVCSFIAIIAVLCLSGFHSQTFGIWYDGNGSVHAKSTTRIANVSWEALSKVVIYMHIMRYKCVCCASSLRSAQYNGWEIIKWEIRKPDRET